MSCIDTNGMSVRLEAIEFAGNQKEKESWRALYQSANDPLGEICQRMAGKMYHHLPTMDYQAAKLNLDVILRSLKEL